MDEACYALPEASSRQRLHNRRGRNEGWGVIFTGRGGGEVGVCLQRSTCKCTRCQELLLARLLEELVVMRAGDRPVLEKKERRLVVLGCQEGRGGGVEGVSGLR